MANDNGMARAQAAWDRMTPAEPHRDEDRHTDLCQSYLDGKDLADAVGVATDVADVELNRLYEALENGDLEGARKAANRIMEAAAAIYADSEIRRAKAAADEDFDLAA